mgnify:CR=1 FL=1|jgi:hypothetical protein
MKANEQFMHHGVWPGDVVRNKNSESGELGLFLGLRTFKDHRNDARRDYTCAEVLWFERSAPNGDRVSTIQTSLIEKYVEKETEVETSIKENV